MKLLSPMYETNNMASINAETGKYRHDYVIKMCEHAQQIRVTNSAFILGL